MILDDYAKIRRELLLFTGFLTLHGFSLSF